MIAIAMQTAWMAVARATTRAHASRAISTSHQEISKVPSYSGVYLLTTIAGRFCEPLRNECTARKHDCSENAVCIDQEEGYTCRCKESFKDTGDPSLPGRFCDIGIMFLEFYGQHKQTMQYRHALTVRSTTARQMHCARRYEADHENIHARVSQVTKTRTHRILAGRVHHVRMHNKSSSQSNLLQNHLTVDMVVRMTATRKPFVRRLVMIACSRANAAMVSSTSHSIMDWRPVDGVNHVCIVHVHIDIAYSHKL